MSTITIPQPKPTRPQPRPPAAAVVITWAERAECTCPDACERDHEQD